MNTKIVLGSVLAFALAFGASVQFASATGMNASAQADARIENKGEHGLRGSLQSFFSRHKGAEKRQDDRQDKRLEDRMGKTFGIGVVTAVDGDVITTTSKHDADVVWTINTTSDTKFVYKGNDTLEVGDRIAVAGTVTDNDGDARSLDASYVLVVDANLAAAGGTITSIDEEDQTVTIDTKHKGEVEVAINSSTVITDKEGDASSFDDLVVGAKVRVQGVWNSLRDLVTAAKVKIVAGV